MQTNRFRDRNEAGRLLASSLQAYAHRPGAVVLALPRGGVPVGYEVAVALGLPLDVFVVRKIGIPGQEEAAMGAVGAGGVLVLDRALIDAMAIPEGVVEAVVSRELRELARREHVYRGGRGPLMVEGRTTILVDDGLATGSTMLAAIRSLRRRGPQRIVVAVPVAPSDTCSDLRSEADEVVCPEERDAFDAVGLSYEFFPQVSDVQVRDYLARAPRADLYDWQAEDHAQH